MCGILGCVKNVGDVKESEFEKALIEIEHRGPDDRGFESFKLDTKQNIVLGHTRLSIIDLSDAGHQPMSMSDGNITLIFNGEIYNYKEIRIELESKGYSFVTETDTEVLLKAFDCWKIKSLKKFVGMFSFAVFDRLTKKIIIVRDAFGIKPLFYSVNEDGLVFSSEIPPILSLKKETTDIDLQSTYNYLVQADYDGTENTFFSKIKHLPPASYLEYDLKTNTIGKPVKWWVPSIEENKSISFDDAVKNVRALFLKSVKLHLRSDVPLGATLSGGIDSSAIVCAMRHIDPKMDIHTFSYIAASSPKSEEKWVDIVNAHTNAKSHKLVGRPKELIEDIQSLIRAQGEPFGSASIYAQYRVLKEAKENGIKVTLDGQGADEIFAGYEGYPNERVLSIIESRNYKKAVNFISNWASLPGRPQSRVIKAIVKALLPNSIFSIMSHYLGKPTKPKWINLDKFENKGVNIRRKILTQVSENKRRRVIERMRHAITSTNLPALLRHGDRNSMNFSIESRVPFLTIELAEELFSYPEEYLISQRGVTKCVFRAAMNGIVPSEILERQDKIGFDPDDAGWKGFYYEQIEDLIARTKLDIFNLQELRKLDQDTLWRVLNYLVWYREFQN